MAIVLASHHADADGIDEALDGLPTASDRLEQGACALDDEGMRAEVTALATLSATKSQEADLNAANAGATHASHGSHGMATQGLRAAGQRSACPQGEAQERRVLNRPLTRPALPPFAARRWIQHVRGV